MTNTESTATPEPAAAAPQAAHVAPRKARPTTKARTRKAAPKAQKRAKAAKPAAKRAAAAHQDTKKAAVLDLLQRKGGATLPEIAKATGWQNLSIRGFVSGTVSKRMGLKVESSKNEAGDRVYRVAGK